VPPDPPTPGLSGPGPSLLGRGVVVPPGADVPPAWRDAPRVRIDEAVLAEPGPTVERLHERWATRRPVVVELGVDAAALREPETDHREPWQVGPGRDLGRDRLQFLVWTNNWDARTGEPVWWWGRKAARLGALPGSSGVDRPDVVLADGRPAFVDGGPRGGVDPDDPRLGGAAVIHAETVEAGSLRPARHRPPGAILAADQLAAVAHAAGPARIIAPAGSGKTRVLTERLRHLLADRGYEPATVTAVAFNKRAADELVDRTSGLGAHVRTINALGLAVLTGTLGGPAPARRPTVIDEYEVRRLLDGLLDVRRQANTDTLAPYLEGLAAIRIGLRDPAEVEAAMPDAAGLTELWPRFRSALDRVGAVDFDDQVERAIRVLLTEPARRTAAQRRCRHLLVDEFQDLAPAHLLLLRLLAAPAFDVFGVGDDDQVIYGFAGATPSYLIDFDRWFPGATHHALETNYRCPAAVVRGATELLSYNDRRIAKTIRARPDAPEGRLRVEAVDSARMAEVAVAEVTAALDAGRHPRELAVLARVNSALLPVQLALDDAGVAVDHPLDARALERTGIRTALAWLRLGCEPAVIARGDVLETIRRPSRRVSRNVVDMLTKRPRTSVGEIRRLAGRLSGGDVTKLTGYADDIEAVAEAAGRSAAAGLAAVRTTVGLASAMDTLDASRAEADRSSHGDDLRALEQVAALHPEAATFPAWLAERLGRPAVADAARVTLSTVHRVKGREWPVVIIYGAHAEAFPHRLATDVEEERRVFHVAVTRAGDDALVLTDREAPSPFAAELTSSRPRRTLRGRAPGGAEGSAAAGPSGRTAAKRVAAADTVGKAADGRVTRAALASARAVVDPPVDPELWEVLRAWRRELAERNGVPAYVVLSDADLRGVAQRAPATLVELRQCRGLGPTKLERYGDELLATLDAALGRR